MVAVAAVVEKAKNEAETEDLFLYRFVGISCHLHVKNIINSLWVKCGML